MGESPVAEVRVVSKSTAVVVDRVTAMVSELRSNEMSKYGAFLLV